MFFMAPEVFYPFMIVVPITLSMRPDKTIWNVHYTPIVDHFSEFIFSGKKLFIFMIFPWQNYDQLHNIPMKKWLIFSWSTARTPWKFSPPASCCLACHGHGPKYVEILYNHGFVWPWIEGMDYILQSFTISKDWNESIFAPRDENYWMDFPVCKGRHLLWRAKCWCNPMVVSLSIHLFGLFA